MIDRGITRWREGAAFRVWAATLRHPLTYRLSGWLQKVMFRTRARLNGTMQHGDAYTGRGWLSTGLGGWTRQRDMPTPPAKSFRQWWQSEK
jgi:hypothetical protein